MAFQKRILYGVEALKRWVTTTFATKTQLSDYTTPSQVQTLISNSAGDFPDWTNVQALVEGRQYTADKNGYILVGVAGGNGNRYIYFTVNERTYTFVGDEGSYKYGWGCMQMCLPIKKGVIFSVSSPQSHGASWRFGYFVKC